MHTFIGMTVVLKLAEGGAGQGFATLTGGHRERGGLVWQHRCVGRATPTTCKEYKCTIGKETREMSIEIVLTSHFDNPLTRKEPNLIFYM